MSLNMFCNIFDAFDWGGPTLQLNISWSHCIPWLTEGSWQVNTKQLIKFYGSDFSLFLVTGCSCGHRSKCPVFSGVLIFSCSFSLCSPRFTRWDICSLKTSCRGLDIVFLTLKLSCCWTYLIRNTLYYTSDAGGGLAAHLATLPRKAQSFMWLN